jgi:hypothetical protein
MKMLKIGIYYGNANQSHNELSPHSNKDGYQKKNKG